MVYEFVKTIKEDLSNFSEEGKTLISIYFFNIYFKELGLC